MRTTTGIEKRGKYRSCWGSWMQPFMRGTMPFENGLSWWNRCASWNGFRIWANPFLLSFYTASAYDIWSARLCPKGRHMPYIKINYLCSYFNPFFHHNYGFAYLFMQLHLFLPVFSLHAFPFKNVELPLHITVFPDPLNNKSNIVQSSWDQFEIKR